MAGDTIRNADLRELTVLAVEVDTRPQRVHNLEIADAHTYFVGDLEVWGHNGRLTPYALMAHLVAAICGEIQENQKIGKDIWDPSVTRIKVQDAEPRRDLPKSKKPKSCPIYPPKDIRKANKGDKGKW